MRLPKRRRKRAPKPFPWAPWLWFALALNIVAGLMYSPITRAQIIRVSGVTAYDQSRIKSLLQSVRGIPAAHVNHHAVLSKVLSNPRYSRATYDQNLFGRGVLKVTPKKVVAYAEGPPDRLLLEDGDIVPALVKAPEGLVRFNLPINAARPNSSFVAEWESTRMAQLAVNLERSFKEVPWTMQMSVDGVISLQAEKGATVRLGTSEKLQEKLDQLRRMLNDDPDILTKVKRIDLVSPSNPMVSK